MFEKNNKIGYLKYAHPKDSSASRNVVFEYVYVNPAFRRRGLATELLQYAMDNFKDAIWISLWTGRQSEIDKSHIFYKNAGFQEIAYQADYYEDGIGTRLYVKRMNKA